MAHAPYTFPAAGQEFVGLIQRMLEAQPRRLIPRHLIGDRLKAERQALNVLQQGVIQFREGALPFGDAIIHQQLHAFRLPAQAMAAEQPQEREEDEEDERRPEECTSVLHVRILWRPFPLPAMVAQTMTVRDTRMGDRAAPPTRGAARRARSGWRRGFLRKRKVVRA